MFWEWDDQDVAATVCLSGHKRRRFTEKLKFRLSTCLSPLDPTESTPSVLDSFQSGEVQLGHSVELPCIASGYPNPTIRWLKDGRPLPADSRWTRRITGLTISDLRPEDSGNYICEVTNSFGSKEVTGHLNVIGQSIAAILAIIVGTCCGWEPDCVTVQRWKVMNVKTIWEIDLTLAVVATHAAQTSNSRSRKISLSPSRGHIL